MKESHVTLRTAGEKGGFKAGLRRHGKSATGAFHHLLGSRREAATSYLGILANAASIAAIAWAISRSPWTAPTYQRPSGSTYTP